MKLYKRKTDDAAPLAQPDPYIIEHNGSYYVYATHPEGIQLYKSDNFFDFSYLGLCFRQNGEKEYWAPSVMKYEDKFYMYYSSMPETSEDVHEECIKIAVSDNPEGPFEYVKTLLSPFSIDPHAVNTPSGLYLFYSTNDYAAQRPGTFIMVDRLTDPLNAEGNPVAAVRPTIDEEIFQYDRFEKGKHWHTIEGAYYFSEGTRHYLMYSASAYTNETYFVGYSTAHGNPEDLRKLVWKKYPDDHTYRPLLSKNGSIEGTGHNSLIERDGVKWIVYHARDAADKHEKTDTRSMRADVLHIDGDELTVNITG